MNKKSKKIRIDVTKFTSEKYLFKVKSADLILPKTPFKYIFTALKIAKLTVFTAFFVFLAMPSFAVFISAFEAHVINVTATICNQSETHTIGFWKNHPQLYVPLLPIQLGNQNIYTQAEVKEVFYNANANDMANQLKAQLLAMKFNVLYFGIGEFFVESEGKTINEIISVADALLIQDPPASREELEKIKNLLDYLNNLHQINFCSSHSNNESQVIIKVVINEFLPNPIGKDNAPKPNGEWVELYNLSSLPIDIAGWVLYDNSDSHPLEIKLSNSDNNGNVADSGETIVPANGFMVVYLNGAYNGWLNNTGGDSVRLYDGPIGSGGFLIDSYSYNGSAPENKSFARIPDGTGNFVDPIPTPLAPNILEYPTVLINSEEASEELPQTEYATTEETPLQAETTTCELIEAETEICKLVETEKIIEEPILITPTTPTESATNSSEPEPITENTEPVLNSDDNQILEEASKAIINDAAETEASFTEVAAEFLTDVSNVQEIEPADDPISDPADEPTNSPADEPISEPAEENIDKGLQEVVETEVSLPEKIISQETTYQTDDPNENNKQPDTVLQEGNHSDEVL